MKEAWRLTRKDGAPGIDGMTAVDYAKNLEANLLDLLGRIKSGRYQAPPVRRAYIPKADGSPRPLGLPTLEDKVAQRAIVMVLEAVYEQDFLACSYGFRPGRSAHQALQDLRTGFMSHGLRWVLDIDIVKYFDSIPHSHLRAFLDRRVTDGVIRRMIDKWLKAGVLEDGLLRHATEGSPQDTFCITCWMNGSRAGCVHGSQGTAPLSGLPTMPSWRSRTSATPSESSASWAGGFIGMG
jgi:group II intron reverse transcriptase/maturase